MYIFRWLMKHPVIILALYFLSIVAILYSMTRGGSPETNVAMTDVAQVEKVKSAEVDLSTAPALEPSTLTSALVNEEISVATDDAIKTAVANSEAENAELAEGAESKKLVESTENEATTETEPTAETDEVITVIETVTLLEPDPQANSESETQFSEMNAEELLLMAREAYWNNGLEESAQIYQQLIEMNPDVIDYKGELGNVYWRQGFPKKAAELYAEISIPMIEEGNADRVANMVGFIGLFFPEKATEIHNLLQANK